MATLFARLHEIWAASPALKAHVPASSVFTGRVPPLSRQSTPYVRISQPTGSGGARTNASLMPTVEIVFHVWTDTFEQGEAIRQDLVAVFGSCNFTFDAGQVLDMRYAGAVAQQVEIPELTQWQTIVTFELTTALSRAR